MFAALQLQHRVIIVFFALLIAIAALNIITTCSMMVINTATSPFCVHKAPTPQSIRRVFLLQGLLIGHQGAGLGLMLRLGLSWLLNTLPPNFHSSRNLRSVTRDAESPLAG
ncbi:MAG: hypothetical protein U0X75_20345 [Acidobacteriota bacterium]